MSGSSIDAAANNEARYWGLMLGVVRSAEDPEGLHRALVEIPGFADEPGLWCVPFGGGAPDHGGHVRAVVGQAVCVLLPYGDPDAVPHYLPGPWVRPPQGSQTPAAFRDLPPARAALVSVLALDGFTVAVDGNESTRQLCIVDDRLGTKIQVNGLTGEVVLDSASSVKIKAGRIDIEGLDVRINGRPVLVDTKPI